MKQPAIPFNHYSPAPFWSWNTKLEKEELLRQIDEMHASGYGGFFMHSRVGLITGYLSDEWMALTEACAKRAEELGMDAWIYDEDKWPSGYAGGLVPLMDEAYRENKLVLLEEGKTHIGDEVVRRFHHGEKDYLICIRITPLGNAWFNNTTYIDTFNPQAVKAWLDCTHEKYKQALGGSFGKAIKGVFTDEACYGMRCFYTEPSLCWSPWLERSFEQRNGYSIRERAEQLFYEVGDWQKTRHDFHATAAALFRQSFVQQYGDWCRENGLLLTGHLMNEDTMVAQTGWLGSVMPSYEHFGLPGVDKLFHGTTQLLTLKQLTSVTEQLDKPGALCECFAGIGHDSGFVERKQIADWMAVHGINFINPHLALYSMQGERKRDYPPNLFYQQPWWPQEGAFSGYLTRLCEFGAGGRRRVRLLVVHPLASVWCVYDPMAGDTSPQGAAQDYDEHFTALLEVLAQNQVDFHLGDETLMEKHGIVKDGALQIGKYGYDVVVLPDMLSLSAQVNVLLKDFVATGGLLLGCGKQPALLDGSPSGKIVAASKQVDSPSQLLGLLPGHLRTVKLTDRLTGGAAVSVHTVLREEDAHLNILLANISLEREVQAEITIQDVGVPLMLCLSTGEWYRLPWQEQDGQTVVNVCLHPAGSLALCLYPHEAAAVAMAPKPAPLFTADGVQLEEGAAYTCRSILFDTVQVLQPNVLPISHVHNYKMGEQHIAGRTHLSQLWHHGPHAFYKQPDGTPFSCEYHFTVSELPKGALFVAIENAENLDTVELNGIQLQPLRRKGVPQTLDETAWLDVSFTRIPLGEHLCTGKNILRISGIKVNNVIGVGAHVGVNDFQNYHTTELETIYIVGDFCLENTGCGQIITTAHPVTQVTDITRDGYPFYAGSLVYRQHIHLPDAGQRCLIFPDYRGDGLRLEVDGQFLGDALHAPYTFDLSSLPPGDADLTVTATGDLFNLMGPGYISTLAEEPWIQPGLFNETSKYTGNIRNNPFGLRQAALYCRNP